MKLKKTITLTFVLILLAIILIGGGLGITYFINKSYDIGTLINQYHIGDITISNKMKEPYEWQLRDRINKYNQNLKNNFKITGVKHSTNPGYNEMVTITSNKLFNKIESTLYFNMYTEEPHHFSEQPGNLTLDFKEPKLVTDSMIIGLWCAINDFNAYDFIGIKLEKFETTYALFFASYVPWITINIPHTPNPYAMLLNVNFKTTI